MEHNMDKYLKGIGGTGSIFVGSPMMEHNMDKYSRGLGGAGSVVVGSSGMEQNMDKYLKGTTTIGLVCAEGVVLAADHRATMGTLIADKEAKKLWKIDEHLAVTIAGVVGDNLTLVRLMQAEAALYKVGHKPIPVEAAATLLSNILNQMRMYPMFVQMIIAGYDTEPRVFEMDMIGGMTSKKYSSTGSGSPVAYGVLEMEYQEGMSLDEGIRVAARAMKAAIERDAAVGNGIDIATITKKGFTLVPSEQIKTDNKK